LRTIDQLAQDLEGVRIVNLCEQTPHGRPNIGDHWSAVHRVVGWVQANAKPVTVDEALMLGSSGRWVLSDKMVIIGGGGLIGPKRFEDAVRAVLRQHPIECVAWGIGHNWLRASADAASTEWYRRVARDGGKLVWPEFLADMRFVGLRDWAAPYPWVPCASALLPHFEKFRDHTPSHDVLVVNHYERSLPTGGLTKAGLRFRHLTNLTTDLDGLMLAIADAKVIVTNSYHVVYWGQLMKRPVVCVERGNTRFDGFRSPPAFASLHDYASVLDTATAVPEAWEDARRANQEMSARVLAMADSLGLLPNLDSVDTAERAMQLRPEGTTFRSGQG
jgi:hypothetical protein